MNKENEWAGLTLKSRFGKGFILSREKVIKQEKDKETYLHRY